MRDIRFRVWDKSDHKVYKEYPDTKRMTYYANPSVDDDGYIRFESVGQTAIGDSGEDRFDIMQYTGLKDKNDKEIYEGDILKYTDGDSVGIHEVIWNDATDISLLDLIAGGVDWWVVGNRYENPELLKE